MDNKLFKEILISLSLANLLFAATWRSFLYPTTFDYHIKFFPNSTDYFSILLCVTITAAIIFGGFKFFQYYFEEKASTLIHLTFLFTFFVGINIARLQFPVLSENYLAGLISLIIFLITFGLALTKWRESVLNLVKVLVLMISPFVFITFSQSILGIINSSSAETKEVSIVNQLEKIEPSDSNKIKNRVIWIIFDEFDYRVAFDLKPIEMPEFEKLRKQSLFATNANSPSRDTLEAIPSLLTGKLVEKSNPSGRNELELNFSDRSQENFSKATTIFSEVNAMNGNSALIGFYHSYCRVIGKSLSACDWQGEKTAKGKDLPAAMLDNLDDTLAHVPLVFSVTPTSPRKWFTNPEAEDIVETEKMVETYHQRLNDIKKVTTDPNIDLAFIHLPYPHPPAKYNMHTKEFSQQHQDYVNNLALTDIILGEIRKSLEESNQWDDSTIIISTDHRLRVERWKDDKISFTANDKLLTKEIEDPRIPFFVKMKNQDESIVYEKPFNTVITKDLIVALMKGNIETPSDLKNWLDNLANSD